MDNKEGWSFIGFVSILILTGAIGYFTPAADAAVTDFDSRQNWGQVLDGFRAYA
jgi:hypothetical protein